MSDIVKLPETKKTANKAEKADTRNVRLSNWEIKALRRLTEEALVADPNHQDSLFFEILSRKLEATDAVWARMPADHPLATK